MASIASEYGSRPSEQGALQAETVECSAIRSPRRGYSRLQTSPSRKNEVTLTELGDDEETVPPGRRHVDRSLRGHRRGDRYASTRSVDGTAGDVVVEARDDVSDPSNDREEFATTSRLLAAMAMAASSGVMTPATASGIATAL